MAAPLPGDRPPEYYSLVRRAHCASRLASGALLGPRLPPRLTGNGRAGSFAATHISAPGRRSYGDHLHVAEWELQMTACRASAWGIPGEIPGPARPWPN